MRKTPVEILAANVTRHREAAGLSKQDLADRCGIARQRISEIEAGEGNPTLARIVSLAEALGVNPDVLIRRRLF